ncbi:Glutamate racemase [Magnetospirillum sp. LM-5]|uniref:glutamate racemase n=1 Tax=Magnetospirillum sp. LM-5 TaxID=2681466 RepID=UPI00137FE275|nr:glutamate racemase [Magnetospirillum sp. LM-5]CAA7621412.1 Glutamate racemase [Magnetospirillum sp. LM-5]
MITLKSQQNALPVGIFDSGIGGLTVAAALRRRLPGESLLYLGDVARLPYGTKSPETVIRYALQGADHLRGQGVKMLVLACNTASAHALAAVRDRFPDLPVVGVVEDGAALAAKASHSGRIVVAATEGTCTSGAFPKAILAHRPDARVTQVACPMFVALAEEGMEAGPIAEEMAKSYLGALFTGDQPADCLVLGCTHFPLLRPAMRAALGDGPVFVDCADAVAEEVARVLKMRGLAATGGEASVRLVTTDGPHRFAKMAARFFPELGPDPAVEMVDL